MRIRPLTDDDVPFLWEMLCAAIVYSDDVPLTHDDVRRLPELAKKVQGWGRQGDRAYIAADDNGEPLGAAWFRSWTDSDHVFGYVDAGTPEIGIALKEDARGKGYGFALLQAVLNLARSEGIPRLSLAVERVNLRALRLYHKVGFRIVRTNEEDHVMVLDL